MATAPTLKQRKTELTKKVCEARKNWQNIRNQVHHEVRVSYPRENWWQQWGRTDKDVRVVEANARLHALCEAAQIMGAAIYEEDL